MKAKASAFLFSAAAAFLSLTLAPPAVLARNNSDIVNQLVSEGILAPQQASILESRINGGSGFGRWGHGEGPLFANPNFGFVPGSPTFYNSNLIQQTARQLDHLSSDNVINHQELYALKSQLDARVKLVNEHPGISQGGGYAVPSGYCVNPAHGAYVNPSQYNSYANPSQAALYSNVPAHHFFNGPPQGFYGNQYGARPTWQYGY